MDIKLSQAIAGYTMHLDAKHLSQNTINDYTRTLIKFQKNFSGDVSVQEITAEDVEDFFSFQTVSNKTLKNYHSTLSTLWTWLQKQKIVSENVMKIVDCPKPERRVIDPISVEDIKALMKAAKHSDDYIIDGRKTFRVKLDTDLRSTAIILFLLDNGIRATELCNLQISDMDFKNLRAFVHKGKGSKDRIVPFSSRTGNAIWKYHASRGALSQNEFVFVTDTGDGQLNRHSLLNALTRIADRAHVQNIYTHRFRHTFAINYLRAGGDLFTLQAILGHETLDMVRRYSRIAAIDIKEAHRRASPVEYMRL